MDFLALAEAARKVPDIAVPVLMEQGLWLESMGINVRLQVRPPHVTTLKALCESASKRQADELKSQCERLVSPDQMGSIFKFMCIHNKKHGNDKMPH